MIWYFLAGFISGAVGVVMLLLWWIRTHVIKVTPEQMRKDIEEYIQKASTGSGDMPLIVISTVYSEPVSSGGPTGNGKLDSIKELIEAGGYSSVYRNELFEAYYPDN